MFEKKDTVQRPLSRRDFLKAAGVSAAGAAAAANVTLIAAAPVSNGAAQDGAMVEVWTGFGQGRMATAMEGAIEQFMAENDGYTVDHVVVPWGEIHDQVIAATAAGDPPDSYRGWAWIVPDDAAIGALTPLREFIETEQVDLSDFWEPTINQMTYQDEIYAMSISTIVNPLFYNQDRMREVGIDTENLPTDLEGWEALGDQMTEVADNGEIQKVGFIPQIPNANIYHWLAAFGGEVWDADSQTASVNTPEMQELFNWYKSYSDRFGIENIQAYASTYGGNGFGRNTPEGVYYTGLLAVWTIGSWLFNDMNEYGPEVDFGVAKVPGPAGAENYRPGSLTANMYFVPQGSSNPKGGFDFATFMASSPWVAINKAVVDSVTPSRKSLAELPEVEESAPWIPLMRDEVLPFALPLPSMPAVNFMNRTLQESLDEVQFGNMDIEEALTDAERRIQREVDNKLNA